MFDKSSHLSHILQPCHTIAIKNSKSVPREHLSELGLYQL